MRPVLLLSLLLAALAAAEPRRLFEHEAFTAEIPFRNPNDRALRIAEHDSTCSCDQLEIRDRFLLPFQASSLGISLGNRNRSGAQSHQVWLYPSNPGMSALIVSFAWEVIPDVSVDLLDTSAASTDRPEALTHRDVYAYTTWIRPEQAAERLGPLGQDIKVIRLGSPPESRPEGGLQVTGIDYAGAIWSFQTRQVDEGTILLIASGAESLGTVAPGAYSEEVVVHTNQPHKPAITLTFHTALDPQANMPDAPDPWAKLR